MAESTKRELLTLDIRRPIWDRFFMVAPLIVVGTREEDGSYDLAPKHMAMPLGWNEYFGFVCTPDHATYHNAKREGSFTVSFVRPDQVVLASLTAAPRCDEGSKPHVEALPTIPATVVDGVLIENASVMLECHLDQVVDGFGRASLIAGRIIAARIDPAARRASDKDDQDVLAQCPLLAYLPPGRYARIDHTFSFPFPAGFKR